MFVNFPALTLAECGRAFAELGKSEQAFALGLQVGIMAVLSDFLNSYWPDLQVTRLFR